MLSQAMPYLAFAVLDIIAELLNVGRANPVARADLFDRCIGTCFVGGDEPTAPIITNAAATTYRFIAVPQQLAPAIALPER